MRRILAPFILIAVLGMAGYIAQFFSPVASHILNALCASIATAFSLYMIAGAHARHRHEKMEEEMEAEVNEMTAKMPRSIEGQHNEDGTTTLFVTLQNGDVTTLVTPVGYNPRQDPEWLLRQLLPEEMADQATVTFLSSMFTRAVEEE